MAGGTSSSKRKSSSSSSHKKKLSKNSSEVKRKKNRSKKRDKSKKLHRRDVSVSYSDDDSRTEDSLSISSSDSEDEYRYKRARSRTRGDAKGGSKKRVRRSSSSHEGSRDSTRRRKRKRSKRNDGVELRKKMRKQKPGRGRSRREASVDSISSDSLSCSSCRSRGSEYEGYRGRSKRREKDKRRETSTEKGRYRYRSRSVSTCSECSEHSGHHSEERLMSANHSRRLKSVLTIVNGHKDADIIDHSRYENKAETIPAYDDFPLCRSDDSYDGGRKDSSHLTHVSYEKKRLVDDGKVEENFTQSTNTKAGAQRGQSDPATGVVGSTKTEIKSEISTSIGGTAGDDLESILRQKALENLRKYRGVLHTTTKAPGDQKGERENNVKQPSTVEAESIKKESYKEVGSEVARANNPGDQKGERVNIVEQPSITAEYIRKESYKEVGSEVARAKHPSEQKGERVRSVDRPSTVKSESLKKESYKEVGSEIAIEKRIVAPDKTNIAAPRVEKSYVTYSQNLGQIPDGSSRKPDASAKWHSSHAVLGEGKNLSDRMVADKDVKENNTEFSAVNNKSSQANPSFRHESSRSQSIIKQVPTPQDSPDGKSKESKNTPNKNVAENSAVAFGSTNALDADKGSGSAAPRVSSSVTSVPGEQGSSEPGDAAKGCSEFEQKTMSVMRGGEMVQVSYKVYIPKKPPALARRQLKR